MFLVSGLIVRTKLYFCLYGFVQLSRQRKSITLCYFFLFLVVWKQSNWDEQIYWISFEINFSEHQKKKRTKIEPLKNL